MSRGSTYTNDPPPELVDIPWQQITEEPDTPSTFHRTEPSENDPRILSYTPLPTRNHHRNNVMVSSSYTPPPPSRSEYEAQRRYAAYSRECSIMSRRMMRSRAGAASSTGGLDGFLPPSAPFPSTALVPLSTPPPPSSPSQHEGTRPQSPTLQDRQTTFQERLEMEKKVKTLGVERIVVERLKTYGDVNPIHEPSKSIHNLMDTEAIPRQEHKWIVSALSSSSNDEESRNSTATLEPTLGVTKNNWGFGAKGAYDGIFSRSQVLSLQHIFQKYQPLGSQQNNKTDPSNVMSSMSTPSTSSMQLVVTTAGDGSGNNISNGTGARRPPMRLGYPPSRESIVRSQSLTQPPSRRER
eukprot:PhF_6_TR11002/c1_g1_i1/m.17812